MPPKEPIHKLTVSAAAYNEIASALEKEGLKLGVNVGTLVLERGTELVQPIDYRLATIRKDAGLIAARAYGPIEISFVDFMDSIYQYIINGPKQKEWK
jgi:hypothetical protein